MQNLDGALCATAAKHQQQQHAKGHCESRGAAGVDSVVDKKTGQAIEQALLMLLRHLAAQRDWAAVNAALDVCEEHNACVQAAARVVLSNVRWSSAVQIAYKLKDPMSANW